MSNSRPYESQAFADSEQGYDDSSAPQSISFWNRLTWRMKQIFKLNKKNAILALVLIVVFIGIVVLCLVGSFLFINRSDTGKIIVDPRGPNCLPIPPFKIEYNEDRNYTDSRPLQTIKYVVVKNAKVISTSNIDAKGRVKISHVDLLFEDGKIKKIGQYGSSDLNNLYNPSEASVVDVGGRFVTAGIVDMHSHLGVYSNPGDSRGHADGNEMGNTPVTPMVRAVDALNPKDLSIIESRKHGGVTTALVLPGSANVVGGEGAYIKLRATPEYQSVSSLLFEGAGRSLKMACGENPKRVYGENRHVIPYSRMGSAYLMRSLFTEARKLQLEQDNWDCNESVRKATPSRPHDLTLDSIVSLLRGSNMTLNVHCYEVQDLEMMIRLSKEFSFKINAFHHALEAYKIADILERNQIAVATFADLFGFKVEAMEASVHAPTILRNRNVRVALKSDHPVISAKYLLLNAAKSHFYGLDEQSALNSVTSVPAEAMAVGNRVGRVEEGYDADIVVWDRFPLLLGARPNTVFIDGNKYEDFNLPIHSLDDHVPKSDEQLSILVDGQTKSEQSFCSYDPESFGLQHKSGYSIKGAKIYTMNNNQVFENGNLVVDGNGIISCVGSNEDCPIPTTTGHVTYTIEDGIVVPGLIEASTSLGLYDIESEPNMQDGTNYGMNSESLYAVQSSYGVRMRSRNIRAAWKSGVTTSVTHRQGKQLINGVCSTFTLEGLLVSESLISPSTALFLTVGVYSKEGGISESVSSQISYLRETFNTSNSEVIQKVLHREIPVAAIVNQADDIGQLIELKKEFGFELIIIGGAEAYLIADRLRDHNISVILTPVSEDLGDKINWETKRSKHLFGASELFSAGVKLAVGMGNSAHDVRNLRFISGLISKEGGKESPIDFDQALAAMTSNVADMFHLGNTGLGRIIKNTPANFVLYDGNPLNFSGRPKVVAVKTSVDCSIVQF
ncbi:hypothetical protein C9374_007427 [Naegleria lovaniensis]|uniref:Amidohydrolase-related domain-containing protein n=1 Tax=Naegleria lovaniensis TaxID=51637 RepID=A0AA88KIV7_NAELO|nr:uncharacterized protein C9374_007427 [Naegleria lovaniensis]KAG2379288.1 hypothetical protein C9374_007427 [Naegleria lovaniensis]